MLDIGRASPCLLPTASDLMLAIVLPRLTLSLCSRLGKWREDNAKSRKQGPSCPTLVSELLKVPLASECSKSQGSREGQAGLLFSLKIQVSWLGPIHV